MLAFQPCRRERPRSQVKGGTSAVPLKVCPPHKNSKNYRIRGTVRGIRVDESAGTDNRAAAEELRARREAELLDLAIHGRPAEKPRTPADITFAEAFLSYVDAPDRSNQEKLRASPLLDHFQETALGLIDQLAVDAYIRGRFKPGISAATINREVYTPITAIMRGVGYVVSFRRPKVRTPQVDYLTPDQADRLIQAAAPHLQPLLIFLLCTGCRMSEALNLQWSSVDLRSGRARIVNSKNGESRGIPLIPELVATLGNLPHRNGHVFRNHLGDPYAARVGGGGHIKTGWKAACRRAGLYHEAVIIGIKTGKPRKIVKAMFSPHDLRHTFASWLTMRNVPIRTIQELLGHKDIKMTQRYSHLSPDHIAESVREIGKNLGSRQETARKLLKLQG